MGNDLLDRLLDRLLTPPDVHLFSWRYALRIILITAAIHASGLIVIGITEPTARAQGLHLRDVWHLLFAVGLCVFHIGRFSAWRGSLMRTSPFVQRPQRRDRRRLWREFGQGHTTVEAG